MSSSNDDLNVIDYSWPFIDLESIVVIRHGQAEHNLADDFAIPDPSLTKLGIEQVSLPLFSVFLSL